MNSSDHKNLPEKYSRLMQAGDAGLIVPRSLLLSEQGEQATIIQLNAFIAQAPENSRFIVRSAHAGEDGASQSLAGHFWSSAAVSAGELTETIARAKTENLKVLSALGKTATPCLLVQEYIEHRLGGVLFWPWSFFSDYICLDYSADGVRQVVEGRAQTAVLALSEQVESPLPLADEQAFLLPLLRDVCLNLKATFGFAFDCEWGYSEQQQAIVILQVRPQTHAVGPVLPLPANKKPGLSAGNWQFTALSESLGRLSPLSFSLFQQLYADTIPVFRTLGCAAQSADFLQRFPDGTVLVNVDVEQAFYAPTRMGGFWRGFREPGLQKQAGLFLQNYEVTRDFSYTCLTELFSDWMMANFMSKGAGRLSASPVHGYEVSWYQPLMPLTLAGRPDNWVAIAEWAREYFLVELNKLKAMLAENRQAAFCQWNEYQGNDFSAARARQHEEAQAALYDHVALVADGDSEGFLSLAATKSVTGKAFVIHQPASHHGTLPADCILFAPYFDNRWISSIALLRGIVVAQGSQLSHSAIVAREHGVPYCVLNPLDLHTVQEGMQVCLDTVRKTLTWS